MIDRLGDEFLADAAFPFDQHGDVLGGDLADRLVNLLHGRRLADDQAGGRGAVGRGRFGHKIAMANLQRR